ncbi:MAG: hypothetical protein GY844_09385, partial [Bradyrhizobium sp.]|nr:hypothetical protein [Bradyrhizobium sp.]
DPEPDIAHIKKISIQLEAATRDNAGRPLVQALQFVPQYHDDGEDGAGAYVGANPEGIEAAISGFVELDPPATEPVSGPLDFGLVHKCYVVIRLEGQFWEFARRNAVTTKQAHANARYYNLRTHIRKGDDRISAISFCARTPLRLWDANGTGVKHGLNLHVDFVERARDGTVIRRLPVIIDPDVENRGNGGR